jgi:hypothetical protein
MARPDDIPEDVWATALAVSARATKGWRGSGPDSVTNLVSEIARAVHVERERCAGVAEMHEHRGEIAAAIRAPHRIVGVPPGE